MSANIAETSDADSAVAPSQLFVINLCASTSPMALAHPSAPELKRYTFFVSRQREDGRERFRLHMGYFGSQVEAEKMLEAVRDVYPAAWAGLVPASGAPRRRAAMPRVTVVAAPVAVVPVAVLPVPVAPVAVVPVPAVPVPRVVAPPVESLESMSNVRDVLAQLSEAAVPAPARVSTPALAPVAVREPAPAPVSVPRLQPAARAAAPLLSDVQALHMLEKSVEGEAEVRVVTPEDTQTLTDIRIDVQNNAPPCFAVQLIWSVSPIDVASLPHLAIFDAYTLYNVEGNRQGRKWFGLRLGFFSDPNSATQVANYVRSDYRAVAIVPVATKERDSAGGGAAMPSVKPAPRLVESPVAPKADAERALSTENLQGFELLADDRPAPVKRDLDDQPAGKPAARASKAAAPAARTAAVPPKAAGKPTGKRVMVRKRPDAMLARAAPGAATPLESTLEILGASTLTLDDSREIINDSVVRKPVDRKNAGGNRFSKLLSRLGGN
jgi:hypothetical protein